MAPKLEPLLKMPVARARSRLGNHSATVLMEAGKLPASPMPKALRTRTCIEHQAADEGVEDAKNRPDDERKGQAQFGADFIDDPAGEDGHAGVKGGEGGGQIGEVGVGPAESALAPAGRRRIPSGS